jgi:hypothetical protein
MSLKIKGRRGFWPEVYSWLPRILVGVAVFLVGEETWRSRALDVQFLHPASERVWMKTQYKSGTLGSFNDPIRIL